MISYLILLLSVSLVLGNSFDFAQSELRDVQEKNLDEGFIRQKSNRLIQRLIHKLSDAYDKGSEAFNNVLNDPDVQGLLDHMNGLTRRIANSIISKFKELVDKIDRATKTKRSIETKDLRNTRILMNNLCQILLKAYKRGGEYFYQVLDDPDVQTILEHLGPLYRKIANSIIENFKQLIEKIDNATKETTEIQKRDEFSESSYRLFLKLKNILEVAYLKGSKAFNEALEDPDFKAILNSLDGISRRLANMAIENLKKLVIAIDKATNDKAGVTKREIFTRTRARVNELIQILLKASRKGAQNFYAVLNDPDVVAIIDSLEGLNRKIVNSMIEQFKKLLGLIDEATKEENSIQERDLKKNVVKSTKELIQLLLNAYKKGSEYFFEALNDPDVQTIIEHLGPLSKKVVGKIIINFVELIDKIDQATKVVDKRSLPDFIGSKVKNMIQNLLKATREGAETFYKVLNDPDVIEIRESLQGLTKKFVDSLIEKFKEIVDRIDEATKEDEDIQKRALLDKSITSFKKLIQMLLNASERGVEYFYEFLNDPDVQNIINHLGSLQKKAVNLIIENIKEILERIDNATKE